LSKGIYEPAAHKKRGGLAKVKEIMQIIKKNFISM